MTNVEDVLEDAPNKQSLNTDCLEFVNNLALTIAHEYHHRCAELSRRRRKKSSWLDDTHSIAENVLLTD